MQNLSPQQGLERAIQAMWANDRASQWPGMALAAIAPTQPMR